MSICRVFSCVVGRGVCYDHVFSWQNSISLCPVSFCTPRPNLPVTPGVSWLHTFAFQSPIMKKTSIFWVLKGLVGLHRTTQLLQHYWLGPRLGLPWYWMVCLGNKQRSFCHFWDCIQVLHFGLFFFDYYGYSISSKGFLPTVVDIMHIWVKFTHSSPFISLIPRMSTFTLAIFCLTTSNLLWFMALTFWVPMQLLFTALDLPSITSHIHNGVLFLLWLHPFILSGVISPLISSSVLCTYRPGEFLFQFPIKR